MAIDDTNGILVNQSIKAMVNTSRQHSHIRHIADNERQLTHQ